MTLRITPHGPLPVPALRPPPVPSCLQRPVAVKAIRLRDQILRSPLSKIASQTFQRLIHHCTPDSVLCARVIRTSNLYRTHRLRGVVSVNPRRRPVDVRLFSYQPSFVTRTTHVTRTRKTGAVSVGVNYPIGGVAGGKNNSSLLHRPRITRTVIQAIITTISIPIAIGAHVN